MSVGRASFGCRPGPAVWLSPIIALSGIGEKAPPGCRVPKCLAKATGAGEAETGYLSPTWQWPDLHDGFLMDVRTTPYTRAAGLVTINDRGRSP
jgi:hypothetical protein